METEIWYSNTREVDKQRLEIITIKVCTCDFMHFCSINFPLITYADLWGKILKLEVTSNNLMAIQQKCIDTSKLPTPSFVTKKYEKNTFSLKMNTELPFKYLIAVGLKQNGPMRTSEIMHWLR